MEKRAYQDKKIYWSRAKKELRERALAGAVIFTMLYLPALQIREHLLTQSRYQEVNQREEYERGNFPQEYQLQLEQKALEQKLQEEKKANDLRKMLQKANPRGIRA